MAGSSSQLSLGFAVPWVGSVVEPSSSSGSVAGGVTSPPVPLPEDHLLVTTIFVMYVAAFEVVMLEPFVVRVEIIFTCL